MTIPQSVWDRVREELATAFQELAQQIQQRVPDATVLIGRSDNPVFPFGSYATFRTARAETGIDVSVDCKRSGDQLVITADVAREAGYVLSDGPTTVVNATAPSVEDEIARAFGAITAYVRGQAELIATDLVTYQPDAPS